VFSVKLRAADLAVGYVLSHAGGARILEMELALTLQLAFRIAIVWAGGFVLATVVRALLPDHVGIHLMSGQGDLVIPFSRMGFWTCLLAALIVTGLVVIRAMLADFGVGAFR
jgi:hypothetical protein